MVLEDIKVRLYLIKVGLSQIKVRLSQIKVPQLTEVPQWTHMGIIPQAQLVGENLSRKNVPEKTSGCVHLGKSARRCLCLHSAGKAH